ncbi:hypothetical protein [Chlamydia avium]|uniref:Uncharacterized protein n=1 Tax=Chlamydia avium TaxID=1457141 RepID=A0ABP2X5I3_9CHLA|nr:hypothetical protein [Chlamydia avium]EPP37730.1 hypothetical protein CP10743SC13_0606 [Chlamydia psittaci 10_743_SC13]EPP38080.1 hypothetical protein CP10881SC42_0687 [Chlamydia avium]
MVAPHEFGAFANRPGRNVFTLQDVNTDYSRSGPDKPRCTITRSSRTSSLPTSKKTTALLFRYGIFLLLSCLIHAATATLLLVVGSLCHPALIAAVILEVLMAIGILMCLAWTSCKLIETQEGRNNN